MQVKTQSRWPSRGIAGIGFLLLYNPLGALVMDSFLTQRPGPRTWTLQWYTLLFSNTMILEAFYTSLMIGFWTMLISTLIGTLAALGLRRQSFFGRKFMDVLTYVPLIMPEIVMGLALLIWFVFLRMTLGTLSTIFAHVTFSVSYVIITVKTRLTYFDETLEEAAFDLGASNRQTFQKITLPLIFPGILSGALMAFTLSFDDFLITFFTAGVGSDTLPIKIYSMIKFGVSPEINALSTLMLGATLILVPVLFQSFTSRSMHELEKRN